MKYIEMAQEKIGENIKVIQDLIGLNQKNFYTALDSSEPTLKKILSSEQQVYIDLYIQIAFLFGMRLEEISDRTIKLPLNFRELLLNYHKTIGSTAYSYLNHRPTTNYAINRLMNTDRLNEFIKAEKIQTEINSLLGCDYDVSTLSNALKHFNQIVSRQASDNINHKEYKLVNPYIKKTISPYIPSYIKLTQYLKQGLDLGSMDYSINFDSVFKMFEIITQLNSRSKSGKELLLTFNKTPFNETNISNYVTPLLNNGLIIANEPVGSNDFRYAITDIGTNVLNLK